MNVHLYRAAKPGFDAFGYGSNWTPELEHAESYAELRWEPELRGVMADVEQPFGGPVIYEAEVVYAEGELLDLTSGWGPMKEELGLDRDDYDYPSEDDYQLIGDLAQLFRSHGYRWVAFRDTFGTSWLYLGSEPLRATPSSPSDTASEETAPGSVDEVSPSER